MKIMILECVSSLASNYWSTSQALAESHVRLNIGIESLVLKCLVLKVLECLVWTEEN